MQAVCPPLVRAVGDSGWTEGGTTSLGLCVKVRPGALYLARQVVLEARPCALNLVIGSDQIIGGLQAPSCRNVLQ